MSELSASEYRNLGLALSTDGAMVYACPHCDKRVPSNWRMCPYCDRPIHPVAGVWQPARTFAAPAH